MKRNILSTEPYKGTRDFYPEDMAVQQYIFDTWAMVAESYGFEQYGASVLEPAELFESKTSQEIVSEQTYTFTDRGDRRVTLRPEMTPTVARMVAQRRRELTFPLRWYSIPNLFRYERPQRGRLREHWQLNCDLFGVDDVAADIELIALAHDVLMGFGATSDMFEIRLNNRALWNELLVQHAIAAEAVPQVTRLVDRIHKMDTQAFRAALTEIVDEKEKADTLYRALSEASTDTLKESDARTRLFAVRDGLLALGISNVVVDITLMRGFDYYTGTVFECFDSASENNRSLLGGGRYDNLTGLFGGDAISGIGFGLGDVTMRDFLETHNLLTAQITSPTLMVIPTDPAHNVSAEKIAREIRSHNVSVAIDLSTKKIGKKVAAAAEQLITYVVVVGEEELATETYTLKHLFGDGETSGTLEALIATLTS